MDVFWQKPLYMKLAYKPKQSIWVCEMSFSKLIVNSRHIKLRLLTCAYLAHSVYGIHAITDYRTTLLACDSNVTLPDVLKAICAQFEAYNNASEGKLCRVNPLKAAGPEKKRK